jgi:hypothetical protein
MNLALVILIFWLAYRVIVKETTEEPTVNIEL